MTEVERIVKIIMPGLLDYLRKKENGEVILKRSEREKIVIQKITNTQLIKNKKFYKENKFCIFVKK